MAKLIARPEAFEGPAQLEFGAERETVEAKQQLRGIEGAARAGSSLPAQFSRDLDGPMIAATPNADTSIESSWPVRMDTRET